MVYGTEPLLRRSTATGLTQSHGQTVVPQTQSNLNRRSFRLGQSESRWKPSTQMVTGMQRPLRSSTAMGRSQLHGPTAVPQTQSNLTTRSALQAAQAQARVQVQVRIRVLLMRASTSFV